MKNGTVIFDFDGTLAWIWARLLARALKSQTWCYPLLGTENIKQVPGALKTLSLLLQAGYSLGIISDRREESLGALLQSAMIPCGYFRFVKGSEDGIFKPSPDMFNTTLRVMNCTDPVLYIGDHTDDCRACWGADREIEFVGVLTGLCNLDEFLRAGVPAKNIIDSVADLPDFLGVTEEDANEIWAAMYR
ncbi:MAG: HAD-IA family hydrolase [Patescibacteria group bacterium]